MHSDEKTLHRQNVQSFHSHLAYHGAALISNYSALSQAPAKAARHETSVPEYVHEYMHICMNMHM